MVAVSLGKTLDETEPQRRGNSSHVLAPPERMAERFRDHPDAVEESGRLAARLRPHRGPRLSLSRLRGPGRRLEAGRALRRPLRRALRLAQFGGVRAAG